MTDPEKVAIVTGAGSGIGKAVALTLATSGFSVVLAGRRLEALEETAKIVIKSGARALAVSTDVKDRDAVVALFERTKSAFRRLDLLYNNAGTFTPAIPLEELTVDQWRAVVDT